LKCGILAAIRSLAFLCHFTTSSNFLKNIPKLALRRQQIDYDGVTVNIS